MVQKAALHPSPKSGFGELLLHRIRYKKREFLERQFLIPV